jgi:transcriptional regulator with XRE-family HTH domain
MKCGQDYLDAMTLASLRYYYGYSLRTVAVRAGVAHLTVKRMERGGNIRKVTAEKILCGLSSLSGVTYNLDNVRDVHLSV